MAEKITLAGVIGALAELEKAFPRKTTAASFRMNVVTKQFLQGFIPPSKKAPNPLLPLGMQGVEIHIDNDIPGLIVQVLNLDGEVIQVIDMGGNR